MNILRLDMKFNGEHCRSHFQWADASGRHLLIILCIQQVSMTKLWNPIGRQHYVEWAQCWSDKSGARGRAVSNINHQSCTEWCGVQPGPHSLMTQGLWVLCQHMRHHNWTLYIFICTQCGETINVSIVYKPHHRNIVLSHWILDVINDWDDAY